MKATTTEGKEGKEGEKERKIKKEGNTKQGQARQGKRRGEAALPVGQDALQLFANL